jgi:hypothetical protein
MLWKAPPPKLRAAPLKPRMLPMLRIPLMLGPRMPLPRPRDIPLIRGALPLKLREPLRLGTREMFALREMEFGRLRKLLLLRGTLRLDERKALLRGTLVPAAPRKLLLVRGTLPRLRELPTLGVKRDEPTGAVRLVPDVPSGVLVIVRGVELPRLREAPRFEDWPRLPSREALAPVGKRALSLRGVTVLPIDRRVIPLLGLDLLRPPEALRAEESSAPLERLPRELSGCRLMVRGAPLRFVPPTPDPPR